MISQGEKCKIATFYFRKCRLDLANFRPPVALKKKKVPNYVPLVSILKNKLVNK